MSTARDPRHAKRPPADPAVETWYSMIPPGDEPFDLPDDPAAATQMINSCLVQSDVRSVEIYLDSGAAKLLVWKKRKKS